MRRLGLLFALIFAFPALGQEKAAKKTVAKRPAHAKPTPQQIRKFNELEKKKIQIRGRSPNSKSPDSKRETVRAPSPK